MKYPGHVHSRCYIEPVTGRQPLLQGMVCVQFNNSERKLESDMLPSEARKFAMEVLELADAIDSKNKGGKK